MDFLGDQFQKCSRIPLFGSTVDAHLRQCTSLWASLFANRDRYAQCKLCLQFFVDVSGCAVLGSTVDTCTASVGGFMCRSRSVGGDAGSLTRRRSATRIRCTRVVVHRQRSSICSPSAPPPPSSSLPLPPPPPPPPHLLPPPTHHHHLHSRFPPNFAFLE